MTRYSTTKSVAASTVSCGRGIAARKSSQLARRRGCDAVVAEGLQVVTKLRCDANMRFRYTGERTGKQGRPKTYDGKVDWQDLSRFDKDDLLPTCLLPQLANQLILLLLAHPLAVQLSYLAGALL